MTRANVFSKLVLALFIHILMSLCAASHVNAYSISNLTTVDEHGVTWAIEQGKLYKIDPPYRFEFHLDNASALTFNKSEIIELHAFHNAIYFITPNSIWYLNLKSQQLTEIQSTQAHLFKPIDEYRAGFLSQGTLIFIEKGTRTRFESQEKLINWSNYQQNIFAVDELNQLWLWVDDRTPATKLTTLPWSIKSIAGTPTGVVLVNQFGESYLWSNSHLTFTGLKNIEQVEYQGGMLYSQSKSELLRSEIAPPFKTTRSSWPNVIIDRLYRHVNSLWLVTKTGKWQKPNLLPYAVKSSQDPTLENDPQSKMLNNGLARFLEFTKGKKVYDFIYLWADRWAIASDVGVFLFAAQQGQFQLFSERRDITGLFTTGADELWLASSQSLELFQLAQHRMLATLPMTKAKQVVKTNNTQYLIAENQMLFVYNTANKQITKVNLPAHLDNINAIIAIDTFNVLASNDQGIWEIVFTTNWEISASKQLSTFNASHIESAPNGAWVYNKDQIGHISVAKQNSHEENYHFQLDQLDVSLSGSQITAYRDKLLLLKEQQLSLLSHYSLSPSNTFQVIHARFNSLFAPYSNSPEHLWHVPETLTVPPLHDSITLWLSHCTSCQYHYSIDDGKTQSLSTGERQFTIPIKNVEKIRIDSINGDTQSSQTLRLRPNIISVMPWSILLLIILAITSITVIWIWFSKFTKRQNQFATALMDHSKDAIFLTDEQFHIIEVNEAYCNVMGFQAGQVIGHRPKIMTKTGRNKNLEQKIAEEIEQSGHWSGELWINKADKNLIALDLAITKLTLDKRASSPSYYLGVFSDITSRKENENALLALSTRDPVTGLANRNLFMEACTQAIASCTPTFPSMLVLLVDIDNFRKINDLLGHQAGDLLLKEISMRFQNTLDKGYTIARYSSDEFAILVPPYLYSGMTVFFAKKLADTVLKVFAIPFIHNHVETTISASIGLAVYPDNGHDGEHLLRAADSALSHSKQQGNNTYQFFDSRVHSLDPKVLSQESALFRGIENKEFIVVYQPKYHGNTYQLSGFEALARWPQSDGSSIPPNEFIPLAERNGAIVKLTEHLLELVFHRVKRWRELKYEFGRVAVNISALHFQNKKLIDTLSSLLKSYSIPSSCIELEITESAMMENQELALQQMNSIKSLGFTIALDDFGTGHSSLGQLKNFPIDVVKIDRSFIKDIVFDEQDRNITSTIIRLTKYLNMEVVAEGVETEEQAYLLNVLGCTTLQGYYFSKPLLPNVVDDLLHSEQTAMQANLRNE
ncbi:diguanylate cyclase/phosphodiesterase (GGDEF & EAL domains) with PAS/PAC sensor(s) [Pseudoalteromonas luteoviolacea B = ATCC 29581]|nr:diguanylate cyclase/phosphodiesterase (GGDEF & EAL domains) with PAS/PAC sensor(s) [Pseudoalteromonas luteoviolacea B = ATCC 29581]